MKRLAIFVEGQTEQIFVRKLLEEIAGEKNIKIVDKSLRGRQKFRILTLLKDEPQSFETKFYVLLYDSGSDSSVVSDIREQHSSLTKEGYEKIIGLRDLYPKLITEQETFEKGLKHSLPKNGIPTYIVLAVMEVEAWFLSEWNHFAKIDASLTVDRIHRELGFHPENEDMEKRSHPSEDLDNIYQLVGQFYQKNKNQVNTIVSNLDFEFLYLNLLTKVLSLKQFVGQIDSFLST